jgi:hypothetical protein
MTDQSSISTCPIARPVALSKASDTSRHLAHFCRFREPTNTRIRELVQPRRGPVR